MRRIITLTCLFSAVTLFIPCTFSQDYSNTDDVVRSNTRFAIDLYRKLKTDEGNLFFSPYSISTALAMAYGGARGDTAVQMADVLQFTLENGQLHSAFAEIQSKLDAIQKQKKVELSVANSLWPADEHPFLTEYLELVRKYYRTEITPLDFEGAPEDARKKINSWAEEKTNGRIQEIIPKTQPPFLEPLTRLVLANAIYFMGEWISRFEESDTAPMLFHLGDDGMAVVPMMHQESDFRCFEDEFVQMLEMPYAGNDVSMVIVLPRQIEGLKDAFDDKKADFSGMDGNRKPPYIYIYAVLHKAFVDVTEKGTEAAVVTTVHGCFPAGTEVLTDKGLLPIETVEPGAKVYACDLATGDWTLSRVLDRRSFDYRGDMVDIQIGKDSIQSTGNQPFYVSRGEKLSERPISGELTKEERAVS